MIKARYVQPCFLMQKHPVLSALIAFAALGSIPAAAAEAAGSATAPGSAPDLSAVCGRADAALARPELAAYRGWIKYLRFDAESATARGATPEAAQAKARRFD